MSTAHLPTQRLVDLAEREPDAFEMQHLLGCADCAERRATLTRLLRMLRLLEAVGAPPADEPTRSSRRRDEVGRGRRRLARLSGATGDALGATLRALRRRARASLLRAATVYEA
jgi:hypothetical protein